MIQREQQDQPATQYQHTLFREQGSRRTERVDYSSRSKAALSWELDQGS
jgi:hypothetical protein